MARYPGSTLRRALSVLSMVATAALVLAGPALGRQWQLVKAADGLGQPVHMTHVGDDRLFVVSKEGRIWIVENGQKRTTPYLDIRDKVLHSDVISTELGILSMAFHPNYAENGYFFVVYTREGDGAGVLSRFSVSGPDPNLSPSASERVLMVVPQPGPNHNLNFLSFGPDGHLYMSSGDGGYQPEPRCSGQQKDSYLGKILRLDVDGSPEVAPYYTVPADNPFVDDPTVLDEIWALGLRNAWRFAWDPLTGDLWITDVGQTLREEINFLPAGSPGGDNFGFKMMEGKECRGRTDGCVEPVPPCFDPAYTMPVIDYAQEERRCAIIGGPVYRGAAIPDMQGAMIAGDYCGATYLAHKLPDGTFELEELSNDLPEVSSFGVDSAGEVYALLGDAIYKIVGLVSDAFVDFEQSTFTAGESSGSATIRVVRSGDVAGAIRIDYAALPFTAGTADFTPTRGTLSWGDGEGGVKTFEVAILDDAELEGNEEVQLLLSNPVDTQIGTRGTARLIIEDDELGGTCVASDTTLCLNGDRFRVTATWRNFEGGVGVGHAVPLDALSSRLDSSGLMWFFTDDNMEVLVKVLDACGVNNHYWVFLSAATDVEFDVRVIDTDTGAVRNYQNPLGVSSPAVTDVGAFSCTGPRPGNLSP